MNIFCNRSIWFSVAVCISIIFPVQASDSSSWPYYAMATVGGAVAGGAAVFAVQKPVDHASEKLTNDVEEKAEDFVNFLLEGKKEDGDKSNNDNLEDLKKAPPIEKLSDVFKETVESASQQIEQSGHQLTVDLAQNIGRMMLSYTLGLFGAFFAYKQIVDYFALQEKLDHLDITAQEQKMLLLPQGNFASFLQKREQALAVAKREQFQNQQNRKFYLAGCGSLTFAAACGLCSYWIQ